MPNFDAVIARMKEARLLLGTVESCTGGQIAARITDVPGASSVYWGSVIAYDNSAKEFAVGIPAEDLIRYSAVSPETARALAENGLNRMLEAARHSQVRNLPGEFRGGIVVSTTGIAGPLGGSAEKPVGLCFIGLARSGHPTQVFKIQTPAGLNRAQNREHFTREALSAIEKTLSVSPE